ncbi:MAG: ribonuclease HI family protein [Candidatus Shapirobacteria bacterium]
MDKMIKIFTDGGARGNPGPAAAAFVVKDKEKILFRQGRFLGTATNNVAEYQAVVLALRWLVVNDQPPLAEVINFYLDSLLVVSQLNGRYKIKDKKLQELAVTVRGLEKELNSRVNYAHIAREKNYLADKLVNQILDDL